MPTSTWIALLTALAPLLVGDLASRTFRVGPKMARRLAVVAAVTSLVGSVATAVVLVISGPSEAAFLAIDPAGFGGTLSVHVDALTALMLVMVSIVGSTVTAFSVRYLDGDPAQARFSRWLAFTLSAVLLLVVSGNLIMLWLSWVASSFGLHQLLTFYNERPGAVLAARKKLIISRLGDLFLLFAFLLIYLIYGTVEYEPLFDRARQMDAQPWTTLAGLFLVFGAITKSAQLPLHSWLPDTMETPTPVSAFMHAGIINAGGFLLIRLSPALISAPLALEVLTFIGGSTAVFASTVMLTQTDIKRKLAWSTIAQMGFMMLQIGLGAFALAALHIVGHSFYKAHAFLSSASTVRTSIEPATSSPDRSSPGWLGFAVSLIAGAVVVLVFALPLGVDAKPGGVVLSVVLALAVSQIVFTRQSLVPGSRTALLLAVRDGAILAAFYYGLAFLFDTLLRGSVAQASPQTISTFGAIISGLVIAFFSAAVILQAMLPHLGRSALGRRLYIHAYNGFYLGTVQDRLITRLWPVRSESPATR